MIKIRQTALHNYLFAVLILLMACHPSGNSPVSTISGNETAQSRSPRYHADSLRTQGRAMQLFGEKRYRDAISCLDSVFLLPAGMDVTGHHPDSLRTSEARALYNQALRSLMVNYNVLIDFEGGLRHLDSLEHAPLPFLQRYCLRGLYVAKAQMLMPLDRHREALDCLNRAMLLARREDSLAATFSADRLRLAQADGTLESPENDSYWSAAAGITYMGVDTISTPAEQAFLRVIGIARCTGFRGGLYSHSIARLADIYLHQSKYEESIALCREALDMAPNVAYDQGRLIAAENLSEAYRRLGLYEEALRYCDIVIDSSSEYEILNNLRGRSYINKSAILGEMQRPAEAFIALQQADSCFDRTGNDYFKLQTALERAYLLSNLTDSLDAALHLFASFKDEVLPHRQAIYHYYYGDALVRAGQFSRALPLLERAVPEAESISEREIAYKAAQGLIECYRRTGRNDRLAGFMPRYQALIDSVASDAKIRQLASANIRFETGKKEQENRALAAEVALKDSRLQTTLLIGILCLLLAAAIIVWGVMRHRALTLRHRLDEQEKQSAAALLHEKEIQLHNLIETRQHLHDRNLDLLRQLSDIQSAHENTCNLDRVMESLQQSLFSKEDTESFRRNFSALYPRALNRLRTACPEVTRNEELFCMLVLLRQTNEEMARTLGINPRSVTKIRYRLRLKFGLPEGADVEAEIIKTMEKGAEIK